MSGATDQLRAPLMTLGSVLVLLGAMLLLFLGAMVYFVIAAPQDVAIVQFVLEHVRAGDAAIYGHMTDAATGRKVDFMFNWSESVRTVSFLFLGVALLGILAGIAKIMIGSGIGLIRLAAVPGDGKP